MVFQFTKYGARPEKLVDSLIPAGQASRHGQSRLIRLLLAASAPSTGGLPRL